MTSKKRVHFKHVSRMATALFGLAALTLATGTQAQPATRPVVVELFTSQGCSSCPPADALLGELSQRNDVIALGYHVDYWDYLGWKDPLSAPGSTRRQAEYGRLLDTPNIYTPQMVIDGHVQLVGSDRSAVLETISRAEPRSSATVTFAQDGSGVTIGKGAGSGKILLVRFQRHRETTVARGENAGTNARDINGVTAIDEIGQWNGQETHLSFAPHAADEGIAVLVQGEDGHMIGANAL